MICRLCLCKFNDFVPIFDESDSSESVIAKVIAKYFHIELQIEDAVSNKICNPCWKHLDDFHKFWLVIEEKQQTLQKEAPIVKWDHLDNDSVDERSWHEEEEDVKNIPLFEHPIDAALHVEPVLKAEEFDAASSDDEYENPCDDVHTSDGETTADSNDESSKSRLRSLRSKAAKQPSDQIQRSSSHKNKDMIRHQTKSSVHCKPKVIQKQKHFSTKELRKQLKLEGNTELKCKVCDRVSANIYALRKHMLRSHPPDEVLIYPCTLCTKKFAKKYLLDDHLLRHCKVKNKSSCEMCKNGSYSKRELEEHRRSEHANELKIICDCCGKGFKCKKSYDNHYKIEHLGLIRPEVQCKICGKWLKVRSLSTHMNIHRDRSSDKEFECSICGAVKPTKIALKCHKTYHHPEKMHKCTLCNKEFKRLLILKEHMAVHTGQPLYSCCFCPLTFKSHANLYTHKKRLHRNEWVPKSAQVHKIIMPSENNTLKGQDSSVQIAHYL